MNIIKFTAVIDQKVYRSNDFAIYSVKPKSNKDQLEKNNRMQYSIKGYLHELEDDVLYHIEAIPIVTKYGMSYDVVKIYGDAPKSLEAQKKFIEAILTEKQSASVLSVYPNIVELIMTDQPIDHELIHGVGKKTLQRIRDKITQNFMLIDIIEEYGEFGFTPLMIKKLYDAYTNIEVIKKKLKEEPYKVLTDLDRVGFIKADEMILSMNPDLANSNQRMYACIDYLLVKNELDGHVFQFINHLYADALKIASASSSHFLECIKDSDKYYLDKEGRVSRNFVRRCEMDIASRLIHMLEHGLDPISIDIEAYRNLGEVSLTDDQLQLLHNFCKYPFSLLEGYAGTGKSFSTKALINLIENNQMSYVLLASTGRASKVLSEYTNRKASTIHRELGYNPQSGYKKDQFNQLEYDVVIVDEASMMDIWITDALLKAINPYTTRLVFIQDPEQIPSVSSGNISFDLIKSNVIPKASLTDVFRYEEGGLSKVSSDVRSGLQYLSSNKSDLQTFGEKQDYVYIPSTKDNAISNLVYTYQSLYNSGIPIEDIMVLSPQNKGAFGTYVINSILQKYINPDVGQNSIKVRINKDVEITFREGDRIMQTKNDYNAETVHGEIRPVFNGDMGVISQIDKSNKLCVVNFDGIEMLFTDEDMKKVLLGYCLSIHKSQGSSAKYVLLLTLSSHKFILNRNILYVGLTRAKGSVYHFADVSVINHCLKHSINRTRRTYLKDDVIALNDYYSRCSQIN